VETVNLLIVFVGVLLVLAGGISGSLVQMQRARRLHQHDRDKGVSIAHLKYIAGGIGALAGIIIGALAAYYLSLNQYADAIAWVGRFSYVLIAWSASGHVLTLVYVGLHIYREEGALKTGKSPARATLVARRILMLDSLRREHKHYIDFKSRDEEIMDDLVGFIAEPLLNARRDMARLPLYGYLGTVCGILLMAQELGQIDEASQTFKILSSMAEGLALAFKTTLIALVSYLPLRKAVDYLLQRATALENAWLRLREEGA
jgi:hypothetical protein|tara:strand:+ start:29 stop:808 length:780 start_codon:yes stop_codon:yes gene_type:complete